MESDRYKQLLSMIEDVGSKNIGITPFVSAFRTPSTYPNQDIEIKKASYAKRFLNEELSDRMGGGIRSLRNSSAPAFERGQKGQAVIDSFSKVKGRQKSFARRTSSQSVARIKSGEAVIKLPNQLQGKTLATYSPIIFDIESLGDVKLGNSSIFGITEISMHNPQGIYKDVTIMMNPFQDNESLQALYDSGLKKLEGRAGGPLTPQERITLKSILKYSDNPDLYGKIDDATNLSKYVTEIKQGYTKLTSFQGRRQGMASFVKETEAILAKSHQSPLDPKRRVQKKVIPIIVGAYIKEFDIPAVTYEATRLGINFDTKKFFAEIFDITEWAGATNIDKVKGSIGQKGSRGVESLYKVFTGIKNYIEKHTSYADAVDEGTLVGKIVTDREAIRATYGLDVKLGKGNLAKGAKLYSVSGMKPQNELDVILDSAGKPKAAGGNSIYKGVGYEFQGIFQHEEGYGMRLYSHEKRANSIIFGKTIDDLQSIIHSNFITEEAAKRAGFSQRKRIGKNKFAKTHRIDSAGRQYRRIFELGRQNELEAVYGRAMGGKNELSPANRRLSVLFRERLRSENEVVSRILSDPSIKPEMKGIAARIALDRIGENKVSMRYNYGQMSMEILDLSNGKQGKTGQKVSRVSIRTASEAQKGIYSILSGATNAKNASMADADKNKVVNLIIDDLINNKKVRTPNIRGSANPIEMLENAKSFETVNSKVRVIADVITTQYAHGAHLVRKEEIESGAALVLGKDKAQIIDDAIRVATQITQGTVVFKNKNSAGYGAMEFLESPAFQEYFNSVDVNKYTGEKTNIKRNVQSIAAKLVDSLPDGYSGALIPSFDKANRLSHFAFAIYASTEGKTTAANLIAGTVPEGHVGVLNIPVMQNGVIKQGRSLKIARRSIGSDGNINNIRNTYDIIQDTIFAGSRTFRQRLQEDGIDAAIAFYNKELREINQGLAGRSKHYEKGLDVGMNMADITKAHNVEIVNMYPALDKKGYITKANFAEKAGYKIGDYFGVWEKFKTMEVIAKELTPQGIYITGKESDISKGIFSTLNIQNTVGFGMLDDPAHPSLSSFAGHHMLRTTNVDGTRKTLKGRQSWGTRVKTDTIERALNLFDNEYTGITAQGKLATTEDVDRMIEIAEKKLKADISDMSLSLTERSEAERALKELNIKRGILHTHEGQAIMRQSFAKNFDANTTKNFKLTEEQAVMLQEIVDEGKAPTLLDIKDITKNDVRFETGATGTFNKILKEEGQYFIQFDVNQKPQHGTKFTALGGEKLTPTMISDTLFDAFPNSAETDFIMSAKIVSHGKTGSYISGATLYKIDEMRASGKRFSEINSFIEELNEAFVTKTNEKPIVLNKDYTLKIAESITLPKEDGNKEAYQKLIRLLGNVQNDDYGFNFISEVRRAKVDTTFSNFGDNTPRGKGVSVGTLEYSTLKAQGLDETADWLLKQTDIYKNKEGVEIAKKAKVSMSSFLNVIQGVELPDVPKFAYGAEFEKTGVHGLNPAARISGIPGISDISNSIYMPNGLKEGDGFKLVLPTTLHEQDFIGTSFESKTNKHTNAKTSGISSKGISEIFLAAGEPGRFDNDLGIGKGYSLGAKESLEFNKARLERVLLEWQNPTEDIHTLRKKLVEATVGVLDSQAYLMSGKDGAMRESFRAHIGNSGRLNARGISPTQMLDPESLISKAGIKENTVIMSFDDYIAQGGKKDLLGTLNKTTGLYENSKVFGLAVINPNIDDSSAQAVKILISNDKASGNVTMTPWLTKIMGRDYDGDIANIILFSGIKDREIVAKEVQKVWENKFGSQSRAEMALMYSTDVDFGGNAKSSFSLQSLFGDEKNINKLNASMNRSITSLLESKVGLGLFTGYANNTSRDILNAAEIFYGSDSAERKLIQDFITTPLVQAPISAKKLKAGDEGVYKRIMDVITYTTGRDRSEKIQTSVIDTLRELMPEEKRIGSLRTNFDEGLENAIFHLNRMLDSTIDTSSAKTFLEGNLTKTGVHWQNILYSQGREDLNMKHIFNMFSHYFPEDETVKTFSDLLSKNSFFNEQIEYGPNLEELFRDTPVSDKPKFKVTGKTALVAVGVASGLFAFNAVRGAIDIASTRMQGRPDEAPGSDGYYIPGGAEGHTNPTARVLEAGAGYEGMQVNIKAYNSNRTDIDDLNGRLSSAISGNMTVPVKINTTTTDNRSTMNRDQIQQIIADTIRG
jgi:hypothetical protein